VAEHLYEMTLVVPDGSPEPQPGQFVSVVLEEAAADATGEAWDAALLRRPFSVAGFRRLSGRCHLRLLYAPVGRITRRMATLAPGASLGLLGPLGTAFPRDVREPILLAGGGRGIAPLIFLGEMLAQEGREFSLVYGTRQGAEMVPAATLPGTSVWLSTEAGDRGRQGTVLDLLEDLRPQPATVMTCGPHGMLAAIARWSALRGAACWVSVEAVFGCGTGLCGGCAIPARGETARFLWACRQGPVLPAERVDWECWSAGDL
jgi:dihydroorotate dehydrogenase electron transfer subunit